MGDLVFGPEPFDDLERLVESFAALGVWHTEVVELFAPVSEPDAEHEPTLGDDVESGDLLREHHRVVQRADHDLRGQLHVRLDVSGKSRQEWNGLQPAQVSIEEVLADGNIGHALLLRSIDDSQDVLELLRRCYRLGYIA